MASKKELKIIKQAKIEYDAAKLRGDEKAMAAAHKKADQARGFLTTTKVNQQGKYYQSVKSATPPVAPKITPQLTRNAPAITKITPEQQAKNQKIAVQELQGKHGNIASLARGAAGGLIDPYGIRKLTPYGSNLEQEKASAQNTFNSQVIKNPRMVAQGLKPIEKVNLKGTYEGAGELGGSLIGVDPLAVGVTKGIQKGAQLVKGLRAVEKIPVLVNGKTKFIDAPTQAVSKNIPVSAPRIVPKNMPPTTVKNATVQSAPQAPIANTTKPVENTPNLSVQPQNLEKGITAPKEQAFAQNGDLSNVQNIPDASQQKFKDLGADTNKFNDGQKVSRVKSNTFQNSKVFTSAEKEMLSDKDYTYDVVSEKQSLAEAKQRLESDFDGEARDLPNKANFDGVDMDTSMGILETYLKEARESGDYSKVDKWAKTIQEKGTQGGQLIQSFAKYSRTPEGAIVKAKQTIAKVERDIEKTNPNLMKKVEQETQQVANAVKKAEAETVQELIQRYTADSVDRLTNRISTVVTGSKSRSAAPLQQAFNDLTNELYAVAKDALPEANKVTRREVSATDILKSAIDNKQNYQEVWSKTKAALYEKYADNEEALAALEQYFEKNAIPDFSSKTVNAAYDQAVKELGVDIKNLILNNPKDKAATLNNIKQYILDKTGATGAEAEALTGQIGAKYVEIVNGKNWTMLENLIKERVKKAPQNEFSKVKQLMNMGAYYSDRYAKATDAATTRAINKSAKDFGQDLNNIIRQNKGDKQKLLTDIQNYVLYNSNVRGQDAEILAREIADEYNKILKTKTESVLKQMFPEAYGKQLPIIKQKSTYEKVMELINMGAYDNEAIKNIIKAKNKLPVLENSEIKAIVENMELSVNQTDPYLKNMYASRAEQIMSDKIPAEFREKFRALQRLSLILNPKTLITRNPLGNTLLGLAENVKDIPGAALDKAISLRTGERTTAFAPIAKTKAQAQGFGQGLAEWGKDIRYGVDTSPSRGQFELPSGRIFKNPVLNTLDQFERKALQLGDRPYYQAAYNGRIAELKKLGKVGEEAELDARLYALDRVFQNDSELSKRAVQIRKTLGLPGDLLMPFTQTPANILDKLIDYSPAGLGKAIYQLGATAGKGTFNQKKFVDTLARTFTGGGIAMLTYAMFEKGILAGSLSDNVDVRQAEQLQGKQYYSIKIGDKWYSYDWAQPISGIMAATADAIKAGATKDDFSEALIEGGTTAIDSVFNQSFLSGILTAFSGYSPAAGIGAALLGSTSQVTPTAGANLAKVIDPVMRETYDPNTFKQQANKLIARIPLASKTLPAKVDVKGETIMQSQGRGLGARVFENFLAPYKVSQETSDPVNAELMRLQSQTGDNAVLLNKTPKGFEKDGQNYIFKTNDYIQYQKTVGQQAYKNIEKLMASPEYAKMTDEEKADKVKGIHDNAILDARAEYFKNQGLSPLLALDKSQREKYSTIKTFGVGEDQFLKTYVSTKDVEGVLDPTGEKFIPLSESFNKKQAIDKANPSASPKQLMALYHAFGISEKLW